MSTKAHLVTCEEPLQSGIPVTALCETGIGSAQLIYMWDTVEMGPLQLSTIHCCKKCWEKLFRQPGNVKYVYGVIEEKRREEAEES